MLLHYMCFWWFVVTIVCVLEFVFVFMWISFSSCQSSFRPYEWIDYIRHISPGYPGGSSARNHLCGHKSFAAPLSGRRSSPTGSERVDVGVKAIPLNCLLACLVSARRTNHFIGYWASPNLVQAFFHLHWVHHNSRCSIPYTFRHFLFSPRPRRPHNGRSIGSPFDCCGDIKALDITLIFWLVS